VFVEHALEGHGEGVMDGTGKAGSGVVSDKGIGRRTIIKRAAAAGAVVWTAPVILDSLASPAGAISCTSGCVLVQFPPNASPEIVCNSTSQAVGNTCTPMSPNCSSPTNVGAGFALSDVCISGVDCQPSGVPVFTLNTTSTSCFTPTAASCPAPRQFLAAQAGLVDAAGNPSCIPGTVLGGGGQVVSASRRGRPTRSSSSSSVARARSGARNPVLIPDNNEAFEVLPMPLALVRS
jgi:hypothetical protein